jgi:hypothetical protein
MRAAAYYGQTAGVEEAIAAGHGAAPMLRPDSGPDTDFVSIATRRT